MPTSVALNFTAFSRDNAEDHLLAIADAVRPHFGILALVIGDSSAPFTARMRAAELALAHIPGGH